MIGSDDRRLREFFREIHRRTDPPAPSFDGLIGAGGRGRALRARRAPAAIAIASCLTLAAAAIVVLMRGALPPAPRHDGAIRLAGDLSGWEAPTDFLLRTPGIEFLQAAPRFGASAEGLPGETAIPQPEEAGT